MTKLIKNRLQLTPIKVKAFFLPNENVKLKMDDSVIIE